MFPAYMRNYYVSNKFDYLACKIVNCGPHKSPIFCLASDGNGPLKLEFNAYIIRLFFHIYPSVYDVRFTRFASTLLRRVFHPIGDVPTSASRKGAQASRRRCHCSPRTRSGTHTKGQCERRQQNRPSNPIRSEPKGRPTMSEKQIKDAFVLRIHQIKIFVVCEMKFSSFGSALFVVQFNFVK